MIHSNELRRDPFRFLMEAVPSGKAEAALIAALALAQAAVFFWFCRSMEGAAVVSLSAALCGIILMLGVHRAMNGKNQPVMVWLFAALGICAAVGAHLTILKITPGRYTNTLSPLLDDMWNYDILPCMAWEENFWSGGYLIVCALVSRIETFSRLYALKLIDLVCQSLLACAAGSLVRIRGGKLMESLAAMAACMLAPTVLMNIGCWAQCDSIFAMLTLWGLVLLLSGHPVFGCMLWGAALSFKLQSAFLFPLLIPMFMNRKISVRHILVLIGTFILFHIPMLLDEQTIPEILARYSNQLANARSSIKLSDNAPGIFGLMLVASTREFSGMGMYLAIASALMTACGMLRSRRPLTEEVWLLGAALLAAGLPLVLPQMNARCLFLGGMIAFCCMKKKGCLIAAILLELVSLLSYMHAIFGEEIIGILPLSLIAIAAALLIALELVRELRIPAPAENAEEKTES